MKTALAAYHDILRSAEAIRSDATQRFPVAASEGDTHRQGDMYIILREELPEKTRLTRYPGLKLVPGNSKGSQHLLDSLEGVEVFHRYVSSPLEGPFLKLSCERTIEHPEHGNVILPPGVYEIRYQRDYAEQLRRVRD